MIARSPRRKAFALFWSDGEYVPEWVRFLRHCGGGEVW